MFILFIYILKSIYIIKIIIDNNFKKLFAFQILADIFLSLFILITYINKFDSVNINTVFFDILFIGCNIFGFL